MRKFVLSGNKIDCPSCDGDGTQNSFYNYYKCLDCDGEGQIYDEFWQGNYVKHKDQDLEGWIVGFTGNKAIVEIVDKDENSTQIIYEVDELEHAKEE